MAPTLHAHAFQYAKGVAIAHPTSRDYLPGCRREPLVRAGRCGVIARPPGWETGRAANRAV